MSHWLSKQQVLDALAEHRRAGKTIVGYNGSFDVLHAGHLSVLKEAKSHGDVLVVMINSDESVKKYKGPSRPIVAQQHRAELVAALAVVDHVVLFDEVNAKQIIAEIKPDIYCSGPDWGVHCIERPVVDAYGGKVAALSEVPGFSTSSLVKKMTDAQEPRKAVFLDRDGVINVDHNYVHKIEDFDFVPGAIDAMVALQKQGYLLFVVTNQSGIAREYYSQEDFDVLTAWMVDRLAQEGIEIAKVYHCPHHPKITGPCVCRKPGAGMLLRAAQEFGVSLSHSWMIGDKESDVHAGREVNCKTIKVAGPMKEDTLVKAHHEAEDLFAAVSHILGTQKKERQKKEAQWWVQLHIKYLTLIRRLGGAFVRKRAKRWLNVVKTAYFLVMFPFELLGDALFIGLRALPKKPPHTIKNILIFKPDQMGDVLFTTFLLPHIKKAHPDAQIDYVVTKKTQSIVSANPLVRDTYTLGYFSLGILLGRAEGGLISTVKKNVAEAWEALKLMRAVGYDVVINARAYPPANNLLLRLMRPQYHIAFDISSMSFISDAWARYDLTDTEEHNIARLLDPLNIPRRGESEVSWHNYAASLQVRDKVMSAGLDMYTEPYAVIAPVTFDQERSIDEQSLIEGIKYLVEQEGLRVVLTALPQHASYLAEIKEKAGYNDIVQITFLKLPELATLFKYAKLLITIDSFPAFLGVASGTPTIDCINHKYWFVKGLSPERFFTEARSIVPVGKSLKAVHSTEVSSAQLIKSIQSAL